MQNMLNKYSLRYNASQYNAQLDQWYNVQDAIDEIKEKIEAKRLAKDSGVMCCSAAPVVLWCLSISCSVSTCLKNQNIKMKQCTVYIEIVATA